MCEFEQFLESEQFNSIMRAINDTDTTSRERASGILMMARDIAIGIAMSEPDDPSFGEGFRRLANALANLAHTIYHADAIVSMEIKHGVPPE
jgi:hypothetical protein